MPEFLPPDLVELRDRAAALARETLGPLRADSTLSSSERAGRVRAASKAAGIFPMTQPVAFGGTEASALALVVVRDTLGQADVGGLAGLFGPRPGVLATVAEPLRSSHLLPMLAGEKRGGFAFTEPADAPRPTWAMLRGEELIINGAKSYVTGGAEADFVTALVQIEIGDTQQAAFVVIDLDRPGVHLERRFGTLDGSHHGAFSFTDVVVPNTCIVGAPGDGMGRALGQISDVRMAIAANCVGTIGWIMTYLTEYLQAPRRGGLPRGASEHARLRYGELRVQAYAARSVLYRTARLVDSGENAVNECIAAKAFITEAAGRVIDTAVQLVGGEALVEGHPLEATLRGLRTTRLAEGETDQLYVNVARGRLDLGLGAI